MLTENEARELLHRAAATIEVRPGEPFVEPARRTPRRWLVVAGAAAAVLTAVVSGSLALQHRGGEGTPVVPAQSPTQTPIGPGGVVPAGPLGIAVGQQLVDLAQGRSTQLTGSPAVKLYNEGNFAERLTPARAADPSQYGLCGTDDQDQCGLSPTELLQGLPGPVTFSASASCFDGAPLLAPTDGLESVLITDALVEPCASTWTVQLLYDAQGRIVTVNEVVGPADY